MGMKATPSPYMMKVKFFLSFMKKSREPKFAATPNPQNTQPWQSRERTLSFLSMGQLYQRAFFKVCRKSEARNKVLTGKSVLSQDFFFCVGTRNPGKVVQGGQTREKRFVPAFFARQGRIFMLRYRGCREALRRSLRSYPCTGPRSKKGRERCRPRPSKPSITQPKLESNSPVFVLPVEATLTKVSGGGMSKFPSP